MVEREHADVWKDPLTPVVFLQRTRRVFPERTAVVHGELRWSYAEFAEEVGRMAGALRRVGIETGDRVAILAPNTPWHLVAHFAMPLLTAPLVSINTRLSAREIAYILEHSGARVLPIENPVQDEDTLLSINYTSGTTGMPKGVMFSHRSAYLNALGQSGALGLSKDAVFLWTLPMFHCNGWCMPWAVTAAGGTHVCLRKIDPPEVFELIGLHGVTNFNGAPTVLLMLSSDPAAEGKRFDPPIHVCTGGAPPSPTLLERMEKLGARITHLYGLTETYGPHVLCEMQPEWEDLDIAGRARVMSRQGVPYSFSVYLRVVDEKMADVPPDGETIGEVVMRGNNVMLGYYKDPEASAQAFRGGWFHSGDLGVMHPDGYIELRDRSKDIIISGGENISTIEVENTIYQHPDVQEVAVVAMPDPKWGEVPKAFVTPKPGTNPSESSVIEFTRERLAHFKCPKAVEFCELPKTSTGKIQKFKLREKEWAGKEKRIQG